MGLVHGEEEQKKCGTVPESLENWLQSEVQQTQILLKDQEEAAYEIRGEIQCNQKKSE